MLLLIPIVIYIIRPTYNTSSSDTITPIENPTNLNDLAPVNEAEGSEVYLKAIRWALGNPKIKNMALTGPYGSGKSSILETFKKSYPDDFVYLDISLASFSNQRGDEDELKPTVESSEDKDKSYTKGKEYKEQRKNEAQQLIELSVLQQIFYKVDQAIIPNSRFKRISQLTESELRVFVAGVLAFLFATIAIIFPKKATELSFLNNFSAIHSDAWHLLLYTMLLPGIIWLIVKLYYFFTSSGLKKLNISSGEIEIDPKSEASILNKYLDELIYFFSVTPFNVVIIEDMDRFNDPEIFTKLRELNNLLNSSSQIQRRIIFIYAIRDDMFPDDRTRTKFFDFIIPVIPVINWSNSLQKLKDKLDNIGFNIEKRFITAITLYIDDMRVLKNIFNELMLYKETLKIPSERQTKLLAMIAYKNIYPNDFAALHEEKGMVHEILLTAQTVRNEIAIEIDQQIQEKRQLIDNIQQTLPNNIKELRAAYIQAIVDHLPEFSYFYNGERIYFSDLQNDLMFSWLKKGSNVQYYSPHSVKTARYKFTDIETSVNSYMTCDQREALINQKNETTLKSLNNELDGLISRFTKVNSYNTVDIIRLKADKFPYIIETNNDNRLLRYLLSEGYIDQSYPYLISHFYPGTIGRADMKFLTYINDRIPLAFDYELEKPSGLVDMLADYDFERDVIFNNQLLDELLKQRENLAALGDKVIAQLNDKNKRALEFIAAYVDKGKYVSLFVQLLCKAWPQIFLYFLRKGNDADIKFYLKLILQYANLADLQSINTKYVISKYINNDFAWVASITSIIEEARMKSLLVELDIKFDKIITDDAQTLFNLVYTGDHYIIVFHNIEEIIKHKSLVDVDSEELKTANYSTIKKSGSKALYKYIRREIEEYIDNVLLKLPSDLTDSEIDFIQLLNEENVDSQQKEQLIQKETAIICKLEDVKDPDLYSVLFDHNKVKPYWENIIYYYHEEIDSHLLAFLNIHSNAAELGKVELKTYHGIDKEIIDKMEESIILNDDINIEFYKLLLLAFTTTYEDLDTTQITNDKIEALILANILGVTKENFKRLKENNDPLHINLLMKDIQMLLTDIEEFPLDNSDRLLLLSDGSLTQTEKLQFIGTITPEMINGSRKLATRINEILVKTGKLDLDGQKLKALISQAEGRRDKLILFNYHLSHIDTPLIKELLNGIGGEYASLNNGKRPKFPLDSLHKNIAIQLENKKYISSKHIDEDKKIIRMIGRQ